MRNSTVRLLWLWLSPAFLASGVASAQQPGPYPPPPGPPQPAPYPYPQQQPPGAPAPAPSPYAYPGYPTPAQQPPPAQQPGQPPPPGAQQPGPPPQPPGFGFSASASAGAGGLAAEADVEEPSEPDEEENQEYRRRSLHVQNTIDAATGLLRLYSADSGAEGTFRFSLTSSYFTGTGFLCPPCAAPDGGPANQEDEVTHIGGHIGISATPIEFLEAYFGIHSHATSNSLGSPELLQVLGDTNLGVKAFIPRRPDQIFTAGGAAEVWLLNGTGGIGVEGASFGLRALTTLDLNNRRKEEDRVPLRFHGNLGYLFNNSGNLVEDVERERGEDRISRIERFGLGIDRVDKLGIGLGAEGVFDVVRPFLEWNVDIPVNRQDHVCFIGSRAAGDRCLGNDSGFSTAPSRLTIGARVHPILDGLSLLGALDIGTGATSTFIEEVAPELPWNLHFGLAYAVDVQPRVEIKRVETERPVDIKPAERFIEGSVVVAGQEPEQPVANAIVRYEGRDLTGMVTSSEGRFRTQSLPPGTYTFAVSADGYKDGQCTATIPTESASPFGAQPTQPPGFVPPPVMDPGFGGPQAPPAGVPPAAGMPPNPPPPAMAPPPGPDGSYTIRVRCELQALPKVGNVDGTVRDGDGGRGVPGASVRITDRLNRSLTLTADAAGAFRFENVPPGPVTITVEAPEYLRSVTELDVEPRKDVRAPITLNKRPQTPNVVLTARELKLKTQVHFQHDSAEILPDSMAIIEEIADVLRNHPEVTSVEIQGHTDNSGTPDYNQRLSQERAEAVLDALARNGVDDSRMTAKGYGQQRPLVPNSTDANKAKNRRVQLMIQR